MTEQFKKVSESLIQIQKELDKLISPGPDWQEDVEKLFERFQDWVGSIYTDPFPLWSALNKFFEKYHTNKQNHD